MDRRRHGRLSPVWRAVYAARCLQRAGRHDDDVAADHALPAPVLLQPLPGQQAGRGSVCGEPGGPGEDQGGLYADHVPSHLRGVPALRTHALLHRRGTNWLIKRVL